MPVNNNNNNNVLSYFFFFVKDYINKIKNMSFDWQAWTNWRLSRYRNIENEFDIFSTVNLG